MRVLTVVNVVLWAVLFVGWVPYAMAVGWADPTSVEVRWILVVTGALQLLLAGFRVSRRRPVLG